MTDRRKKAAGYVIGILLLASIVAATLQLSTRPRTQLNRVAVGRKDEIYFLHSATRQDAQALGRALQGVGFLNNRGTTVLLSKGTDGTLVSFVLSDGGWDHPDTVYSFEEIGRRIATAVGGFPIKVRLIDSHRVLHRELNVGKAAIGARDVIFYYGSATEAEARSLGQTLRGLGFLQDAGAAAVLAKDGTTDLCFVVANGVWDRADALAGFERLARAAAPSVGGLPVRLRLLSEAMEPQKTVTLN
jgi:hypothetical protein